MTRREIDHPVIRTLIALALIIGRVGLTHQQQNGSHVVLPRTSNFRLARITEQAPKLIGFYRGIGPLGNQLSELRYRPCPLGTGVNANPKRRGTEHDHEHDKQGNAHDNSLLG